MSVSALKMRDDHLPFDAHPTGNTPFGAGSWVEATSFRESSTIFPSLQHSMLFLKGFLHAALEALRLKPPPLTPILPPELERRIFELAAFTYPECASTLVLVAHRTLIWIEPLLYETVVLGRTRSGEVHEFLRTLRSRPANFFASCVKTLVLTNIVDVTQTSRILSVCTGVVNLISSVSTLTLLPTLDHLPLQRLSINLKSRTVTKPDFSHPSFAKITHLEVITEGTIWTSWSGFDNLHSLTHLALGFQGDARLGDLNFLHQILAACISLKVLVVLAHSDYISLATLDLVQDSFSDPRLAFMREEPRLQDCLQGLRGERDMWSRAEDLVEVQPGTV